MATTRALQGAYLLVTGVWPVVHLSSFERVSGHKVEGWLVRTFGGLTAVVGASLLIGAAERSESRALDCLAAGSAAVIGAADVLCVALRRVPSVYLLDAGVEAGFFSRWLLERRRSLRTSRAERFFSGTRLARFGGEPRGRKETNHGE